jgi:FeS assembly SUF system protein
MNRTELTLGGNEIPKPDGDNQSPSDDARTPDLNDPSKPLDERIVDAIREVYDPEIPVNIYELGLIYDVAVDESTCDVKILMTLTSPACPAAQSLPLEVRRNVGRIAEVNEVDVEIVFDPPWGPEKMTDEAKLRLGMF